MRTELPRAETGRRAWAVLLAACVLGSVAWGATYYVDPVDGSDGGDGSTGDPWQTLTYAAAQVAPGDTVKLRDGSYGDVTLDNDSIVQGTTEAWITYEADSGHTPVLGTVAFEGDTGDPNFFVTLNNVSITDAGIELYYAHHVKITDCTLDGHWDDEDSGNTTSIGIRGYGNGTLNYFSDIEISGCEITEYQYAISLIDGSGVEPVAGDIRITGNHIHKIVSSAIRIDRTVQSSASKFIVEDNHIHDQQPISSGGDTPHGSGLTIRTGYVEARRNIIHNYGNTRGIRSYPGHYDGYTTASGSLADPNTPFMSDELLYQGDTLIGRYASATETELRFYRAVDDLVLEGSVTGLSSGAEWADPVITSMNYFGGFTGLVIENNLIYDTRNLMPIELSDLAGDLIFRNNTIIGSATGSKANYYYYNWFGFVWYGYGDSDVILQNNIFVGLLQLSRGITMGNLKGNIFYALHDGDAYVPSLAGNVIVTDNSVDNRVPYFESGDLGRDFFLGGTLFDQYSFTRSDGNRPHGQDLAEAYQLAEGSPGENYGDAAAAIAAGAPCGLPGDDGFLDDSSVTRSASVHSTGCYETSTDDGIRYFLGSR